MNIGFVMYEWESVKPKLDSTLRLIQESVSRGHKVSLIYPYELNNLFSKLSVTGL